MPDPQAELLFMDEGPMQDAIAQGARAFHNVTFVRGQARARSSFEDLLAENQLELKACTDSGGWNRSVPCSHSGDIRGARRRDIRMR